MYDPDFFYSLAWSRSHTVLFVFFFQVKAVIKFVSHARMVTLRFNLIKSSIKND